MTKNKTIATWLSFVAGPLGLHRFYLKGFGDPLGWMLPVPTLLGLYGIARARELGLDDGLSWVLIPFLGFSIAGCCLVAIIYGLMEPDAWNAKFNSAKPATPSAGKTNWLTIAALVGSLMIGSTALIASLAYSFQSFFQNQVEESRKLSQ
jgi:hypothetical protein